jgi:hypothetical protein
LPRLLSLAVSWPVHRWRAVRAPILIAPAACFGSPFLPGSSRSELNHMCCTLSCILQACRRSLAPSQASLPPTRPPGCVPSLAHALAFIQLLPPPLFVFSTLLPRPSPARLVCLRCFVMSLNARPSLFCAALLLGVRSPTHGAPRTP